MPTASIEVELRAMLIDLIPHRNRIQSHVASDRRYAGAEREREVVPIAGQVADKDIQSRDDQERRLDDLWR